MNNKLFLFTAILALLLLNAFPLYQAIATKGYLFYTNAFDESTYLQYDYSHDSQSISRAGQYIVTLTHNLGLSGGWINFVFDLLFITIFVVFTKIVLTEIGFQHKKSNLFSLLIAVLPLLFSGLNPLINKLFNLNLASGTIYWITIPEASFLPILRTPEPQFSLTVAIVSIYLALKVKSFIPLYLCLPFLYPFIGIPLIFIVVSLHLKSKLPLQHRYAKILAPILAFIITGFLLKIAFNFSVNDTVKDLLVKSHYPLLSFTSCLGVGIYLLVYKNIKSEWRYWVLIVALSPMAASNHQIISGLIAQPNGFEQYFGIYCVAVVTVFAISEQIVRQRIALSVAVLLLVVSATSTFKDNYHSTHKLVLSRELLAALKTDSPLVAINDTTLASLNSMIFPVQPSTLFGYEKTYILQAKKHFNNYLCAKNKILSNKYLADKFSEVFKILDRAYKYEGKDFILVTIGRTVKLKLENDPETTPTDCPPVKLRYFFVN